MDLVIIIYMSILLLFTVIEAQTINNGYRNRGYYPSDINGHGDPVYDPVNYGDRSRGGDIYQQREKYPWQESDNYYNRFDNRDELHPYYNPYVEYGLRNHDSVRDYPGQNENSLNAVRHNIPEKKFDDETVIVKDQKGSVEVNYDSHKDIIHGSDGHFASGNPSLGDIENNSDHFKEMKDVPKVKAKVLPDMHQSEPHDYSKLCDFMYKNHYKYHMNPSMLKMACNMFKEWAYNMKTVSKWRPTTEQKSWFDSLGSSGKRNLGKRHKRQVNSHFDQNRSLRREYRMMTDAQRYRFHRAVIILKNTFVDGLSMYDIFVRAHQARIAPGAHFGPAFLGYHRELLLRFENALRQIDQDVSLPYWDSNLDHILGDELATRTILWTEDFLGNGVGEVTTGPFAHWRLAFPEPTGRFRFLYRNLTVAPPFARTMPALMPDEAILHMLSVPSLRNLTWFVSPVFESHHGAVHNWVGGIMGDIPLSPTDPIFYMHHAFLDCLWEQLRSVQKKRNPDFSPEYDYPNDTEALGVGMEQIDGSILNDTKDSFHYALNPMLPFAPLLNIDGLSNVYFEHFYACEPSPICSERNPNCGSEYLFCEKKSQRCAPKLQLGTSCEEVQESDACFRGTCCNGICQRDCFGPHFERPQLSQNREDKFQTDIDYNNPFDYQYQIFN